MRAIHLICAYSSWQASKRGHPGHASRKDDICSRACSDRLIGTSPSRGASSSRMSLQMMDESSIDRTTTTPPPVTTPLSPMTFAGQVEKALLSKFPQSKIERVLQSWRLLEMDYEHREFVGNQQSPPIVDAETSRCYQHAPSYVPGLKAVAWWDTVEDLPWAKSLSTNFPAIRDEFVSVMSNPNKLQSEGNNIWAGALTSDAESYGVSLSKSFLHVFWFIVQYLLTVHYQRTNCITRLAILNSRRKAGRHWSYSTEVNGMIPMPNYSP